MAATHALRRLARIRELEEQQALGGLEVALAELRRLESLRRATLERERGGRQLIAAGVLSGEKTDWLAGQEEVRVARRLGALLKGRLAEAEKEVARQREVLLARRVERRQAETLIAEAQASAASEEARRAQQATDEWFLDRRRSGQAAEGSRAMRAAKDSAGEEKS